MRPIVIAAVAAVALATAPAAAAKEITSVTACGADGCATTKDRTLLTALMDGSPSDPPSHPGGAIRLRSRVTEPGGDVVGRFDSWWVPGTTEIASQDGSWVDLGPGARAVLDRVAGDLRPFPPGRIGAAYAGPVRTPAARPAPASGDAGGGDSLPAGWFVIGGLSIALALGVAWWRGSSPRTT